MYINLHTLTPSIDFARSAVFLPTKYPFRPKSNCLSKLSSEIMLNMARTALLLEKITPDVGLSESTDKASGTKSSLKEISRIGLKKIFAPRPSEAVKCYESGYEVWSEKCDTGMVSRISCVFYLWFYLKVRLILLTSKKYWGSTCTGCRIHAVIAKAFSL